MPPHFTAGTLHVFGELERLSQLLDTSEDAVSLTLMDAQLPQRIPARNDNPTRGSLWMRRLPKRFVIEALIAAFGR